MNWGRRGKRNPLILPLTAQRYESFNISGGEGGAVKRAAAQPVLIIIKAETQRAPGMS